MEVVGVISNRLTKARTLLEWARERVKEKDIKSEREREHNSKTRESGRERIMAISLDQILFVFRLMVFVL